jgi:replicative DNA helicase
MDIRNIVRMTFLINKIDMIIIDYIQLIQHSINSKNDNRTAELSTITKYIKALSRE